MILKKQIQVQTDLPHQEVQALIRAFPQGITAFDVETTGLSPIGDRIIELSAIQVLPSYSVRTFSKLTNPMRDIPQETQDIHHINDEMVKNSPTIDKVLPEFLEFCQNTALVGHNAKFDAGFLAAALHFSQLPFPELPVFCSLQVAKDAFKKMPNYKLGTLATELNITLENHHRALDDSIASLRLMAQAVMQFQLKGHPELLKKSYLFKMDDFDRTKEFELPKLLQPFKKHIRRQLKIEIIYKGGSHRGKFRPLKPLALLPLPTGAALYALCLIENQHKLFKLNKITDIREYSDTNKNIQ